MSALTYLIRAGQNRWCYQAFRQHTKPKLAGGLTYLKVTDATTQLPTTILNKDEMDTLLLDYSRAHFAKAQGTLHYQTLAAPPPI